MTSAAQRWNARYREVAAADIQSDGQSDGQSGDEPDEPGGDDGVGRTPGPPQALLRFEQFLPDTGLAVDLAGGPGGCALHLAARGLTAVLLDVSDVALAIAERRAAAAGRRLVTVEADLDGQTLGSTLDMVRRVEPAGEITVVSCFHYLNRSLLATVARDLPPGAVFAASIATVANLERHARPSRRFLLEPGELFRQVVGPQPPVVGVGTQPPVVGAGSDRLEVLRNEEGWHDGHHHEADLVVRKPSARS